MEVACDVWEKKKKKKKKKEEEEEREHFSSFYCFSEWRVLTIVGEYDSLTKLVRLLWIHFEQFQQIDSPK
jgi:hypothetical protein